jgi:hypothetical protein
MSSSIRWTKIPRILLANPQRRNLCVQPAFFEGKKAEETAPEKKYS